MLGDKVHVNETSGAELAHDGGLPVGRQDDFLGDRRVHEVVRDHDVLGCRLIDSEVDVAQVGVAHDHGRVTGVAEVDAVRVCAHHHGGVSQRVHIHEADVVVGLRSAAACTRLIRGLVEVADDPLAVG